MLIIFSGLLAYVYFFEIQGEKRKKAKKEKEELLINLDKKNITGLAFLPDGIFIEKDSTLWKISSPVQSEADSSTIETILDAFSWLKKGRFVSDNPNEYKKLGLTPYQYALVLGRWDGSDTISIGETNLDNTNVFYRWSGSPEVFLVPITLKTNITKSLFDLRDKTILRFDQESITEILIKNDRQTYACTKNKSGQWWLQHPIQTLADGDKIDNILNQLHNSRVKRFESERGDQLKKYGLNNPWLVISLLDSINKSQKTLRIGLKDKEAYYAKDESRPSIFLIDSSLVAGINVSLVDLRDKTVVSFEQDSVTEILLQYPDFMFQCTRDSSQKWLITQPDSGLAKSWKINSLLFDIKNITVANFIDEAYRSDGYYGFDHPQVKLTLKKNDSILADLLIGDDVNNKVYIKNNLTKKINMVQSNIKNDLSIKPEEFLDKDN